MQVVFYYYWVGHTFDSVYLKVGGRRWREGGDLFPTLSARQCRGEILGQRYLTSERKIQTNSCRIRVG